ncbi:MAG: S-adenosylmethionine decarboxylase [Candidatus Sungbacteria bacterium]|nr:S-adenosylmethionine decarboxylase [Candidatus Sungbacteria bacterium]
MIGESHLAIHTFHEHGKIYVQLSSCNERKSERFKEIMAVRYPLANKTA